MQSRHLSRQRALQVLFQWDQRKLYVEDAILNFYETLASSEEDRDEGDVPQPPQDAFMESLVRGTVKGVAEVDRRIQQHSANWRIERMPAVDRNLLRLAVHEMMSEPTPPPVVIDEALELARSFSGDESVRFINGVLDSVRKALGR